MILPYFAKNMKLHEIDKILGRRALNPPLFLIGCNVKKNSVTTNTRANFCASHQPVRCKRKPA